MCSKYPVVILYKEKGKSQWQLNIDKKFVD